MYPYLFAAMVGALFANKRVPKTRCSKRDAYGPTSGAVYKVEDFGDAGFIVVHDPDGRTVVTFKRVDGKLKAVNAVPNSDPNSIRRIRKDFEAPNAVSKD